MQLRSLLNAAFLSQVLLTPIVHASSPQFDIRSLGPLDSSAKLRRSNGKVATLVPVNDKRGLNARGLPDESSLRLREDLLLKWATQTEDGTLLQAEMNITSDDGTKLLFMSRFQDFTNGVDCTVNDGDGLAITFKSKDYLDIAKKQWGWVTEDEGNTFWIIANHKDCPTAEGEPDMYVPYKVTDVDYSDDGLTAEFVKSEKRTLAEALAFFNFELSWGQGTPTPTSTAQDPTITSPPQKRDLFGIDIPNPIDVISSAVAPVVSNVVDVFDEGWKKIEDKFGDAKDAVKKKLDEAGNLNEGGKWPLKLDIGKEGEKKRLAETLLGSDRELWCVDCFLRGQFDIEGKIRVEKLDIKETSFSVSPENFLLRMKFNTKLKTSEWTNTKFSLFEIPFAAIDIPFLFHFGPAWRVDLEWGQAIKSDVDFSFGWEAKLPNEAFASTNLVDNLKTDFSGWDKSEANTLDFELNDGEVNIDLNLGLTAVLSFGVELLSMTGYEAALKAPLPHWSANLTTITDEAGACEKKPDASKTAIKVDEAIKAGLNFYVGPNNMVTDGSGPKPLVDKELWKWQQKFPSQCIPIGDTRNTTGSNSTGNVDADIQKADEEIAMLDADLARLEDDIAFLDMITGNFSTDEPHNSTASLNPEDLGLTPGGNTTRPAPVQNSTNTNSTTPKKVVAREAKLNVVSLKDRGN